jgi:hypothetical protein
MRLARWVVAYAALGMLLLMNNISIIPPFSLKRTAFVYPKQYLEPCSMSSSSEQRSRLSPGVRSDEYDPLGKLT